MLTFWALLNKTDIEHYVHSLILPDYMSHLVMEPFRWRNQSRTPDGRTPLIIRYYGPGRIEEIPLSPEVHAERLLGVAKPGIDLTKVRLPEDGVFWNWETSDLPEGMAVIDAEEPYDDLEGEWDEPDDPTARLRLFFFPKESLLKEELPVNVPSHDAYVSVTREEIFISQRMIQDYILARLRKILRDDQAEGIPAPEIEFAAGTYSFRVGKIHGLLIPDDREVLTDLLLFTKLESSIRHIREFIIPPDGSSRIQLENEGILIPLERRSDVGSGES